MAASTLFVGNADAQVKKPTPYQAAADCLTKVSTTYNGKTYNLKEGTHFRPYGGSGDPDEVIATGITLRAGLRDHPSWRSKVGEIEGCLKVIPGLKYVGRSDK